LSAKSPRNDAHDVADQINDYNVLLDELTTLNDEVSELNQGINVTLESEEQLEASDGMLTE